MRKTEDRTITIQVLERAFGLLDLLASHQEPVSLKEISEQSGPAPVDRAPHPQRPDHRPLRRPAGSRQLPPRHAPARAGQPGQGPARRARRGAGADARAAQADAPAGQPVDAPGRRDRLHRAHLQRALGHAGRARDRRPGAAAPHLGRQAVPGAGRRRSACAPTPPAPGWPATPATASPTWRGSSASCRGCASTARRATTRSWNSACAAWPPASSTTRASWWPACRSRRRPTGWRKLAGARCGDRGADLGGARAPRLSVAAAAAADVAGSRRPRCRDGRRRVERRPARRRRSP